MDTKIYHTFAEANAAYCDIADDGDAIRGDAPKNFDWVPGIAYYVVCREERNGFWLDCEYAVSNLTDVMKEE